MQLTLTIPDTLVETIVRGIMDNYPEAGNGNSLRCRGWFYKKMEFDFEDIEEGKKFSLNKEKLLATFPLIFTEKWPKGGTKIPFTNDPEIWNDWLGEADATDFDAFIQLACFGEVIYG